MSRLLALSVFVISIFLMSCSTSEPAAPAEESEPAAPSKYPTWYNSSGTQSDSLSFHGYATAIAFDSSRAVSNAALTAQARLEAFVADEVEEIRLALADEGNSETSSTHYLLILSNAVDALEGESNMEQVSVQENENHYRAFVQSSITKEEVRTLLQTGFEGESAYWEAFSESSLFGERLR